VSVPTLTFCGYHRRCHDRAHLGSQEEQRCLLINIARDVQQIGSAVKATTQPALVRRSALSENEDTADGQTAQGATYQRYHRWAVQTVCDACTHRNSAHRSGKSRDSFHCISVPVESCEQESRQQKRRNGDEDARARMAVTAVVKHVWREKDHIWACCRMCRAAT
jgi:hypothetical protein